MFRHSTSWWLVAVAVAAPTLVAVAVALAVMVAVITLVALLLVHSLVVLAVQVK